MTQADQLPNNTNPFPESATAEQVAQWVFKEFELNELPLSIESIDYSNNPIKFIESIAHNFDGYIQHISQQYPEKIKHFVNFATNLLNWDSNELFVRWYPIHENYFDNATAEAISEFRYCLKIFKSAIDAIEITKQFDDKINFRSFIEFHFLFNTNEVASWIFEELKDRELPFELPYLNKYEPSKLIHSFGTTLDMYLDYLVKISPQKIFNVITLATDIVYSKRYEDFRTWENYTPEEIDSYTLEGIKEFRYGMYIFVSTMDLLRRKL